MGIEIIAQTSDYLIVIKPAGIESEKELPDILKKQCHIELLYCVHRLDKDAAGLILYACHKMAAHRMSSLIQERGLHKSYYVLVDGLLQEDGSLEHYLYRDRRKMKMYPVKRLRKGVKQANLHYHVIRQVRYRNHECTLLDVTLETGRFHQIRAQFAATGMPLAGDRKYGSVIDGPLALYCHELHFYDHGDYHYEVTMEDVWKCFEAPKI